MIVDELPCDSVYSLENWICACREKFSFGCCGGGGIDFSNDRFFSCALILASSYSLVLSSKFLLFCSYIYFCFSFFFLSSSNSFCFYLSKYCWFLSYSSLSSLSRLYFSYLFLRSASSICNFSCFCIYSFCFCLHQIHYYFMSCCSAVIFSNCNKFRPPFL